MDVVERFLAFNKEKSAENVHLPVKTSKYSLQNGSSPFPYFMVFCSILSHSYRLQFVFLGLQARDELSRELF